MYSSIVVKVLVKIWHILSVGYEYSIFHRIIKPIRNKLITFSKSSRVMKFFTSSRSLLEESLFYSIYTKFIDIINRFITSIRRYIQKNSSNSIIYTTVQNLFSTENDIINTFFVFFMAFGIGIIVNNIFRGYYSGRSYVISLVLIIVSSVGLIGRLDVKEVANGSITFRFIKSIFTIDEEVDRWW